MLTAVLDLLLLTTDHGDEARAVLAWTLGGLGGVNWETLWLPELAVLLGIGVLRVQARNANLPPAGEEAARRDRPVRRGRHPHRRPTWCATSRRPPRRAR
ncbi:ABC-type Fe3+-siderophore transport system permease subunit [Streptomyces sp. DSM 40167]|nr:ABC-type Fe3+-siderophore transport system permease subunit [Streptomyces sp. DSM 40167]